VVTSAGRFVACMLASSWLLLGATLLAARGQPSAAEAVGVLGVAGCIAACLAAARSVPRERFRDASELARIGAAFATGSALLVATAAIAIAIGDDRAAIAPAVVGGALAMLAVGQLNASRMLRVGATLTERGEEIRAVAVGANGMPGRGRRVVVATDARIAWAEGRRLAQRGAVLLEDVERFDVNHTRGALTVVGARRVLEVRPVARRELVKFEEVLRRRPGRA
jgi:hypothetical protein